MDPLKKPYSDYGRGRSLLRTRLHVKFPDKQGEYREFYRFSG